MRETAGTKIRIGAALLLSAAITGLYFVLVYQRLPFIYDINDDVAMRNVAAGVITGTPDAHLLHIKYLLGLFISGLYRLFPGMDWYGLTFIGIILFSFMMILYRGLVSGRGRPWKLCYTGIALLLFTCAGLKHLAAFQWTVTAAIAGAAGIFLFYTSPSGDGFQTRAEEGISVVLLLLSLAVRDDVFLMVLPVAALCFWWKYGSFQRGRRFPVALKHAEVPLGLLAGVVLLLGTEAFAYRSPEWREFRTYNVNREAIMDYYGLKHYEEDPDFFDSIGVTREEAENLQRYSLYLADDLYSGKMAALAEHSREVYLREHPFRVRLRTAVSDIWEHLWKDTYESVNLLCFGAILLTVVLCFRKNRRQLALAVSVLAAWGAYWLYLGYRHRILERVGFALYLLALLTMLAILYSVLWPEEEGERGKAGRPYGWAAAAGACAVLALFSLRAWKAVEDNNTWRWNYNLEFLDVNRYMAEHMDNVYFMTTFSIETYTDNFTLRRDFAFSNLLSVGGWHTYSPLENKKDELLGITDPKRDIAEKENVYLISLENVNLRYLDRYYTSRYGDAYQGRELVDALDYGERVFEVYDVTAYSG